MWSVPSRRRLASSSWAIDVAARGSGAPACRPDRRSGCPCRCARPARTSSPAPPRRAARRWPCRRSPPTGPCHRRAPCRSATRRRRSTPGSPRPTRPRRCRPTSSRRWPRCRGRPRRRGCRSCRFRAICIMSASSSSSTSFAVASSSTIALTCRPRSAAQIGADLVGTGGDADADGDRVELLGAERHQARVELVVAEPAVLDR